jgi:hypothetical protein
VHVDGNHEAERILGAYIRQSLRTAGALTFGSLTLAVQHFAWPLDA